MWPGLPMWAGQLVAVPVVTFLGRRSGRLVVMAGPIGSVGIDVTDRRLAHVHGRVRARGGARGRYRVWTQDGIEFSLCASDILTCVFGCVTHSKTQVRFVLYCTHIAEGHIGAEVHTTCCMPG